MDQDTLITLTADVVIAHVSKNVIAVADMPVLIKNIYDSFNALSRPAQAQVQPPSVPAVPVRSSIKPDYIVCLEDGKKMTMLKRHLMTHYSMTPDEYRAKWNLPADYPMVAPNYVARRREIALKIGLGRKPGSKL